MSASRTIIAGVDIGGSHIGVGLLDSSTSALLSLSNANGNSAYTIHEAIHPSGEPSLVINQIASIIRRMVAEVNKGSTITYSLISVGVGCPGQCKDGILIAASNLPKFNNFPLASALRDALKIPHGLLLNDADAAMASEFFGAQNDK
jgi:predicted NBD/HSP70 family sugar kinase